MKSPMITETSSRNRQRFRLSTLFLSTLVCCQSIGVCHSVSSPPFRAHKSRIFQIRGGSSVDDNADVDDYDLDQYIEFLLAAAENQEIENPLLKKSQQLVDKTKPKESEIKQDKIPKNASTGLEPTKGSSSLSEDEETESSPTILLETEEIEGVVTSEEEEVGQDKYLHDETIKAEEYKPEEEVEEIEEEALSSGEEEIRQDTELHDETGKNKEYKPEEEFDTGSEEVQVGSISKDGVGIEEEESKTDDSIVEDKTIVCDVGSGNDLDSEFFLGPSAVEEVPIQMDETEAKSVDDSGSSDEKTQEEMILEEPSEPSVWSKIVQRVTKANKEKSLEDHRGDDMVSSSPLEGEAPIVVVDAEPEVDSLKSPTLSEMVDDLTIAAELLEKDVEADIPGETLLATENSQDFDRPFMTLERQKGHDVANTYAPASLWHQLLARLSKEPSVSSEKESNEDEESIVDYLNIRTDEDEHTNRALFETATTGTNECEDTEKATTSEIKQMFHGLFGAIQGRSKRGWWLFNGSTRKREDPIGASDVEHETVMTAKENPSSGDRELDRDFTKIYHKYFGDQSLEHSSPQAKESSSQDIDEEVETPGAVSKPPRRTWGSFRDWAFLSRASLSSRGTEENEGSGLLETGDETISDGEESLEMTTNDDFTTENDISLTSSTDDGTVTTPDEERDEETSIDAFSIDSTDITGAQYDGEGDDGPGVIEDENLVVEKDESLLEGVAFDNNCKENKGRDAVDKKSDDPFLHETDDSSERLVTPVRRWIFSLEKEEPTQEAGESEEDVEVPCEDCSVEQGEFSDAEEDVVGEASHALTPKRRWVFMLEEEEIPMENQIEDVLHGEGSSFVSPENNSETDSSDCREKADQEGKIDVFDGVMKGSKPSESTRQWVFKLEKESNVNERDVEAETSEFVPVDEEDTPVQEDKMVGTGEELPDPSADTEDLVEEYVEDDYGINLKLESDSDEEAEQAFEEAPSSADVPAVNTYSESDTDNDINLKLDSDSDEEVEQVFEEAPSSVDVPAVYTYSESEGMEDSDIEVTSEQYAISEEVSRLEASHGEELEATNAFYRFLITHELEAWLLTLIVFFEWCKLYLYPPLHQILDLVALLREHYLLVKSMGPRGGAFAVRGGTDEEPSDEDAVEVSLEGAKEDCLEAEFNKDSDDEPAESADVELEQDDEPTVTVEDGAGGHQSETMTSSMPLPAAHRVRPNMVYRYLLGYGRVGHSLIMVSIFGVDWVYAYIPTLASLLELFKNQFLKSGKLGTRDYEESQSSQSTGFVDASGSVVRGGKKRKAQTRKDDQQALSHLQQIGEIGQARYRFVSDSFMRRHEIGPYADELKVEQKAIVEPIRQESDEDSDGDWVAEALTQKGDRNVDEEPISASIGFSSGSDGPAGSVGVEFNFGGKRKKRRKRPSISEVARQTSISTESKKPAGPRVSDRESGVMGRIRAAGANSLVGRSILGAYPGDVPSPGDAADAAGLFGLAQKYGYGDWSEDDMEDERPRNRRRKKRTTTPLRKPSRRNDRRPSSSLGLEFEVRSSSSASSGPKSPARYQTRLERELETEVEPTKLQKSRVRKKKKRKVKPLHPSKNAGTDEGEVLTNALDVLKNGAAEEKSKSISSTKSKASDDAGKVLGAALGVLDDAVDEKSTQKSLTTKKGIQKEKKFKPSRSESLKESEDNKVLGSALDILEKAAKEK